MSEITEASTGPNAAQYEYWNKVAGPRRVGWGGFVERRVRAANDLLLARSAVAPGERVLEVGCGTGAATLPLAEAVGDSGRVVGIDLSEPMLAVARRHVAESGRRNISLLHADAQVYGFEPDSFDLIASRFGVMFFPIQRPRSAICWVRSSPAGGCALSVGRRSRTIRNG